MGEGVVFVASPSQELLDLVDEPDPYAFSQDKLLPVQLAAAQEAFEKMQGNIGLLRQRAADAGIKKISTLEDVVPLLFTHSAYKSYPQSFVQRGQWDRLLSWYNALCSTDVTDTSLEGVANIDDFVDKLWAAGHFACPTSGTSGKCSLLNRSEADIERVKRISAKINGWPDPISTDTKRRLYALGPSKGPYAQVFMAQVRAELFSEPSMTRFLSDEPLLISQVSRMGEVRQKMAEGTIRPDEVAAFEQDSASRQERMEHSLRELAADIVAHRDEPLFLTGLWSQHWSILQAARELGVGDGEFNLDSVVGMGGGLKGLRLPSDYREQLFAFYGPVKFLLGYGMTEMDPRILPCQENRYHIPPWILPLLLDEPGEKLVHAEPGETVDGRFALLSLCMDGRWGGLITGDHVHMEFCEKCGCGRPGPVILNIARYSEERGGDDKIGCAGTMDAYLRGVVGE